MATAATCISSSAAVDTSGTCGSATLDIVNDTTGTTFVVIPKLRRQPAGSCISSSGFTPFLSAPHTNKQLDIPTLLGGDNTTPPNAGGVVDAFYPYNASSQIAYVEVTYVVITASSGITTEDLQSHAASMWSYLTGKVDLGTLSTVTWTLNTCVDLSTTDDTNTDYHISGDNGQTTFINNGIVVHQLSAPHPNRTSNGVIALTFEDATGDVTDPLSMPYLTQSQRDQIREPLLVTCVILGLALLIVGGLFFMREMHHWAHKMPSTTNMLSAIHDSATDAAGHALQTRMIPTIHGSMSAVHGTNAPAAALARFS